MWGVAVWGLLACVGPCVRVAPVLGVARGAVRSWPMSLGRRIGRLTVGQEQGTYRYS